MAMVASHRLLPPRSELPEHVLKAHLAQVRRATEMGGEAGLQLLMEQATAVANRYGANWALGHIGQVSKEIRTFWKLLHKARPRQEWRTVCEVGMNAGHSAMLWLLGTDAQLIEFDLGDLGTMNYSRGCRTFLERAFPGRVSFRLGRSLDTLPRFVDEVARGEQRPCDLWFVDGWHNGVTPRKDLEYAINASADGAWVVADDCTRRFPDVLKAYLRLVQWGKISNCSKEGVTLGPPAGQKGWCMGQVAPLAVRAAARRKTRSLDVGRPNSTYSTMDSAARACVLNKWHSHPAGWH